jgi:hypothetical protein
MKRWTAIKYREFYDIPRVFLADTGSEVFLFDCPFNVERDEYEDTYKIYHMPRLADDELQGSWETLSEKATALLGETLTSAVEFDATRRREVNLDLLNRFRP